MYVCVLIAGAMAHVNGKLEHSETITLQIFPEECISFLSFIVSVGKSKKTRIHITRY